MPAWRSVEGAWNAQENTCVSEDGEGKAVMTVRRPELLGKAVLLTRGNDLKAGEERLLRGAPVFPPLHACSLRNCYFYTAILISSTQLWKIGRICSLPEEAGSEMLRR